MPARPTVIWTKRFGSSGEDHSSALTIGLDGSIYVAGYTNGNLDGITNTGSYKAFVTKHTPDGSREWTRLLGFFTDDFASALTTGTDGAIYVAGRSYSWASENVVDGFVAKYNVDGSEAWTRLIDSSRNDVAHTLKTDADGAIYVAGSTAGNFDGQTNNGGVDGFIGKYTSDGNKLWTGLLGSSSDDEIHALTIGIDGAIYVAGRTAGSIDGQTNSGSNDAFIAKFNPDGSKAWTRSLGSSSQDLACAITTGTDGAIYIAGVTGGDLDGQVNSGDEGGFAAFIAKYSADGSKSWTRLLGSSSWTEPRSLATGTDGAIYMAGGTNGNLDGQINGGSANAFIAKYNANGSMAWTSLSGSSLTDYANALAIGTDGSIYVVGSTDTTTEGSLYSVFLTRYEIPRAIISSLTSYTLKVEEYDLELAGTSAINGSGNALDNRIAGNTGNNILSGMAGDDVLVGGAGKDTLDGGLGEDTADYSDQTADVSIALGGRTPWISVRIGNQVEDRLKNIEHLIGGSGNDSLTGDGKANRLEGGLGNDSLDGGAGEDTLVGGAGDDTYTIDNAGDVIIESSGDGTDLIRTTLRQIDLIDYDHVENLTYTGRGTTFLFGSDLDNVIKGGSGADGIFGGFGSDTLYGGGGSDLLYGFGENYGNDASYGEYIDARIPAERLISPDVLYGGKGNDIYIAGDKINEQNIVELKNEGIDIIFGSYTEYVLPDNVENYCNVMIQMDVAAPYFEIFGNALSNVIQSSPDWSLMPEFTDLNAELQWYLQNFNTAKFLATVNTNSDIAIERFFGMAGNDTLLGGAGEDYLSGGEGRDKLTGGTGEDQFVFDAALNRSTNVDTVTDFATGLDKIVLNSNVFSRFSVGEDVADHFSAAGRALDSDDYLIYRASNKTLFYDADGNGSGAAVAFAVLTGVSSLSASDFLIM